MKIKELPESRVRYQLNDMVTECIKGMFEHNEDAPDEVLLANAVTRRVKEYLMLSKRHSGRDAVEALQVSVQRHNFPNLYLGYSVVVIWPDAKDHPKHRLTVLVDIDGME